MNIFSKYKNYFWIFLLVGFVIYFPILFNGFVWDDLVFIINNPQVHQLNLDELFGKTLFSTGQFYRPLNAIYVALEYSLFGQQAFFYHLVQLLLHIINTCLIFVFFRRFFKEGLALFLALLFLVHPINVESVAWISAMNGAVVFCLGLTTLMLSTQKDLSRNRWILISVLLALALFTRETGVLFFLLIILYRYLFKLNTLKEFIFLQISITALYLLLRTFVGEVTNATVSYIQIANMSLSERLVHIPAIFMHYLKTFIYPMQLVISQQWVIQKVTLDNFIIPLIVSGTFCLIVLFMILVLYKKATQLATISVEHFKDKNERRKHISMVEDEWVKTKSLLFFVCWFTIGIGLILQIIPLDMTVADRWVYFPMIGLLGIIGVIVQILQPRFTYTKKVYICIAVILLSLLSLRTFIRTFDWKDNATLYAHDLREQNDNYMLLDLYAREMFTAGYIDDAILYGKKSVDIYPTRASLNELGTYYQKKEQYNEAIEVYKKSISISEQKPYTNKQIIPYVNTASALLLSKHPLEAREFIKTKALNDFPESPDLYVLLAFAESASGNKKGALEAISQAKNLSPNDEQINQLYLQVKNGRPIKWNPR